MSFERLRAAWCRSDRLLSIVADDAWHEQPIRLRQPFLFYLGHLPAFAWNHVGRGLLERPSFAPELDQLFERGIDPVGIDAYVPQAGWPALDRVFEYRDRVRDALTLALAGGSCAPHAVLTMVVEHELMHHETLLYMVQELDHARKQRPADWPSLPPPADAAPRRTVQVPGGAAVLGAPADAVFGWDNEFPQHREEVAPFEIDDRPVTNAGWMEFVADGGYADRRLWRDEDWSWRERRALQHPHSWRLEGQTADAAKGREGLAGADVRVRSLLEDVPFDRAAAWPVMVSWAEAAAYARWRGQRLPTEPEWHRAAFGSSDGSSRRWPWNGGLEPAAVRANVGFRHGSPTPVGSSPASASGWGIQELVGNGWEWTSSPFAPLPGFAPMPRYPGYSADFFDGRHFVLLGGSWATDEALVRPSFRNWFQPHYPYVFSKLRCARSLA